MGAVRIVLALIVLFGHVPGWGGTIGALAAVQAFFVLSGVYMAAVYSTKYRNIRHGQRLFYLNRLLRLWPTYIVLLALTFGVFIALGGSIANDENLFLLFRSTSSPAFPYVLPSAFFLFGQDVLTALDWRNHMMLPVRQSWSIATELLFYAVVPYICGRWFSLWFGVAILVCCLIAKYLALKHLGWIWSYFFPLFNLGYFTFGAFLYYVSQAALVSDLRCRFRLDLAGPALVICLCVFAPEAGFERATGVHLAFMPIFGALVCLSFSASVSRLDWYLGNISYALYLNHFLVLVVIRSLVPAPFAQGYWLLVEVIAVSVMLAILLERYLQRPIDLYRDRITKLSAQRAATGVCGAVHRPVHTAT